MKIPFYDYFKDLKTKNFLRLAMLGAGHINISKGRKADKNWQFFFVKTTQKNRAFTENPFP